MIHLAPFQDASEQKEYCAEADVLFEEGSVGFKIFTDEEKLALCQIKFVGEAAYILNLKSIADRISTEMLANVFTSIIEFLKRVEIDSAVYPIQTESDKIIAEAVGFESVSDTMYVFDFNLEVLQNKSDMGS